MDVISADGRTQREGFAINIFRSGVLVRFKDFRSQQIYTDGSTVTLIIHADGRFSNEAIEAKAVVERTIKDDSPGICVGFSFVRE